MPHQPPADLPQPFESLQPRARVWHEAERDKLCPNCRFLRNSYCIRLVIVGMAGYTATDSKSILLLNC